MDYTANVFPGKIFASFDFRGAKFLPQTLRPYFPGSNLHVASFLSNLGSKILSPNFDPAKPKFKGSTHNYQISKGSLLPLLPIFNPFRVNRSFAPEKRR